MKIINAELIVYKIPLKETFKISKNIFSHANGIIVKLIGDNGTFGIGESIQLETPWYSHETVEASFVILRDVLLPEIINVEATSYENLFSRLNWVQGHNQSIAAVDTALLDLASKECNLPLYKYIGGLKNYGTVGTSLGINNEEILTKKIRESISSGYKRIKIKIMKDHDIEVVKSIMEKFPDINLMVDANADYSLEDIEIIKELDNFNLMMIEQPFGNGDLVEHAELCKTIKTPVCLDESIHDINDAKMAVAMASCDIVNIKPPRVGGLTRVKEMLDLLQKHKISAWIGGMMETGVGRAANLAGATLEGINYPSDLRPPLDYLIEDIVDFDFEMKDGKMELPEKNGLGVEINYEKLKKYTIKEYSL